jgi:tripartite-type tricarboxylate transporter receptor subunit TctC
MDFGRRALLHLAGLFAVLPILPRLAAAQAYPARPVKLVVGFPAGGPNDILGRLIAQWLTERLGQPFTVENQPGNSGNIATAAVVRAPADGYTLLLVGPANAIAASLYPDLEFNFLRDIAPVAGITREPLVLLVHPSVRARSVTELIADSKAHPGTFRMASTGRGSSPHVSGELLKLMTGLELAVTHYAGGGPALRAMIEGQAQVMFEPMSASIEPVRSGKLRALAVTTATRSAALPNVPTVAESGVAGYDTAVWWGFLGPAGMPADVVAKIHADLVTALKDPVVLAALKKIDATPVGSSPADFDKFMHAEADKWGPVLKAANIKVQ